MATMLPDVPVDNAPYAEQQVYQLLRDALPDAYRVFHSVSLLSHSGNGVRPGEMDFVIAHPLRGLLAVEVKGGREIRCDGRRWTSVSHTGSEHEIKDPCKQAKGHLDTILDKVVDRGIVQSRGDLPFPFGHAVWFPGVDAVEGDFPTNCLPEVTITRHDHTRIQQTIEQALGSYRGSKTLSRDETAPVMEAVIRRVLQPTFRVVRSLRTQIRDAEERFSRMTQEQADRFNGLLKVNRRALVKGFAGTGKTFLAVHRAAELGRNGTSTLLVCFNRHLADHLASKMEDVPNTTVATFHQLADEWAHHAPGRSFPDDPDQDFWDTGAADLLTDAVEYGGIQFDAVLVDEAQDFREAWWIPIEAMLHEDSHFYVFLDPGQDIFQTDVKGLMELPTTLPLRKNCRSSAPISEYAARIAQRDEEVSPLHAGDGTEVKTHAFGDRDEQIDMLATIVRTLKQDDNLSSSDIVLLSPRSYHSCILADMDYRLAGYNVERFALEEPDEGTLYYESIHGFKGMESPVVVLFDVRKDHVASSDSNIYVGCTRARHVLHVVHEKEWTPGAESEAA